ncbi:hypothetical protein WG947_07985 [Pontibacter sp. H259]|uniref:hypothetical protein n=1 Tax=Pontibacter sp. H259 TaxID=3133421 RepID=UPI0030C08AC2
MFQPGRNPYILNLKHELEKNNYKVVNSATKLGILDVLKNIRKFKIIYFNWIEDLPDKRFGYVQIPILFFIIIYLKIFNKKIIWFVHNNISHRKKNYRLKNLIFRFMELKSDVILSHAQDVKHIVTSKSVLVFDHPIEKNNIIANNSQPKYDLLIWGNVSPYKGIHKFLEYNYNTDKLSNYNIMIAGKFNTEEYLNLILSLKKPNITIVDKILDDEELEDLVYDSKFILFTYNSKSILSSAALCKSVSFGKAIIGPDIGSFKDLSERGIIYKYSNYSDIPSIIEKAYDNQSIVNKKEITNYIDKYNWQNFGYFICKAFDNNN